VAYLPDEVFGSLAVKPQLQHAADSKPFAVHSAQSPCAPQHTPELHKTLVIILYFHYFKDRF
jgi:hypothetical protein